MNTGMKLHNSESFSEFTKRILSIDILILRLDSLSSGDFLQAIEYIPILFSNLNLILGDFYVNRNDSSSSDLCILLMTSSNIVHQEKPNRPEQSTKSRVVPSCRNQCSTSTRLIFSL